MNDAVVTGEDFDPAATALLDLLRDDATRARYGRAAREKALAEFDERAIFEKVEAAYERLLGRAPVAGAASD